ncbi:hypothetical protein IMCC3135_13640 [Granulosicoccus antarcticus IMCC3135]|uniref:Uncharacterized protein n=1 Tax=Granulosicoccus antarcticus IMCC3135 TaxID=1192854 RepID=A0A2Z2NNK7_9GAMM|nr:hypothetical protein IMCC3135_13640 [Granulosicoccus antarcticus IMCC3135]
MLDVAGGTCLETRHGYFIGFFLINQMIERMGLLRYLGSHYYQVSK